MITKKQRVRARVILLGDVFQPVVDKIDAGASAEALASTLVDLVDRDDDELVRWATVIKLSGLSKSTINRLEAAGDFPQRVILGKGRRPAVGWHLREVRAWVRRRTRINKV